MIISNAQLGIYALLHMNYCTTFAQLYLVGLDMQQMIRQGTLGTVHGAHHPEIANRPKGNGKGANPALVGQDPPAEHVMAFQGNTIRAQVPQQVVQAPTQHQGQYHQQNGERLVQEFLLDAILGF